MDLNSSKRDTRIRRDDARRTNRRISPLAQCCRYKRLQKDEGAGNMVQSCKCTQIWKDSGFAVDQWFTQDVPVTQDQKQRR